MKEIDSSRAERTQRLAEMGEMAARIAHEIRNPLGSIELLASLIERETENERHKNLAGRILSSVKNLDSVVSNLLFYTRAPRPVFKTFSLSPYMEEVLEFVGFLFTQNHIELKKSFSVEEICVTGDGELLKQAFLNVIYNAVQAMPNGGSLRVSTGIVIKSIHSQKKRYAEVQLTDSGTGIPAEDIKKIYNPFFTTKERGTGLGLAIAHNIIDTHNGIIEVKSTVGKGTTFKVLLNMADQ